MIKKLHNGTLKTVTNIRVPKKWKRFEYLESTGTLWIDTDYKPTPTTFSLESSFYVTNVIQSNVMGCRTTDGHCDSTSLNMWIIGGSLRVDSTGYNILGPSISTSTKYIYTISPTKSTINGTNYDAVAKSDVLSPYSFILFGMKSGSNNASSLSYLKLYETKLYEGTVLIRDFVPCEYNGQYGMWDLVENKFYGNKGTGTFKVGPEVPNYDEIEYIKRPNHLLPNGVELYDYIEMPPKQYINTEVYYEKSLRCRALTVIKYKAGESGRDLMGFSGAGGGYWGVTAAGAWEPHSSTINTTDITQKSTVDFIFLSSSEYGTYYIGLLGNYSTNYSVRTKYIYSVKLERGTTLVRNFLPCTYFGEPGMWDTVTNKFYGNSGTGQFKLGNKLTDVLARTSDGLLLTDNKIYIEPDGSKWIRIFHHNNPASYKFSSNNTFNTKVYIDENRWFDCSILNTIKGPYEFIAEQTLTSGASKQRFRFIQLTNPYVSTFNNTKAANITKINTGYTSLGDSYGGFYYNNMSYSFFVLNSSTNGNWWGAVGSWSAYLGGVPGYNNSVCTTGYMDLYLRVDELLGGNVNIYEKKNALIGDGTAIIDTNYKIGPSNLKNMKMYIDFMATSDQRGSSWWANGLGGSGSGLIWYAGIGNGASGTTNLPFTYGSGTSNKVTSVKGNLGVRYVYILDMKNKTYTVSENGNTILALSNILVNTPTNTYSPYIFAWRRGDTGIIGRTFSGKLYRYRLYDNDILVRDFIPATLGGKPGLYDKVEHKMYYNANSTGQFTVE